MDSEKILLILIFLALLFIADKLDHLKDLLNPKGSQYFEDWAVAGRFLFLIVIGISLYWIL